MTTIQEIEAAVAQLPPEQLAVFQQWLAGFVAQAETDRSVRTYLDEFARQAENERVTWQQFAAQNLARAYEGDEPEYSAADLKSTNPGYAGR